uniref:Uncharacterized protein n=1 Tax=Podoviridae sp. ctzeq1 TaxID=2826597 RepID=A0A8S5M0H5_9CAUD|nr:MAG TPA: hypothetical protein [Podoviridae sp. ctzeq1]
MVLHYLFPNFWYYNRRKIEIMIPNIILKLWN